jgi:nucleoside-diphosphate-sugar epimerase
VGQVETEMKVMGNNESGSRVLVTGGTGLVGSHLLYELCRRGHRVRAIRREGSHVELVSRLFSWYSPEQGEELFRRIEWVAADVLDLLGLKEALDGMEYVYHCAAMVSFLPEDRKAMMKVNVDGTANLVNLALQTGVKKLCHCSSVAAIGKPDRGNHIDETLVWKTSSTNSWYAISKYGAEREVWRASEEGLPVVIVNPTVVIGPGDPGRSSAQLYQSVKNGLKFYTSGVTGFVDARDVAEAMVRLMESDIEAERYILSSENLMYRTLFEYFAKFSGARPPRLRAGRFLSEMAWRLEKVRSMMTGQKPLITRETARNANNRRYFNNRKITAALDFRFRSIEEAAENTSRFFRRYPVYLSPDFRMNTN